MRAPFDGYHLRDSKLKQIVSLNLISPTRLQWKELFWHKMHAVLGSASPNGKLRMIKSNLARYSKRRILQQKSFADTNYTHYFYTSPNYNTADITMIWNCQGMLKFQVSCDFNSKILLLAWILACNTTIKIKSHLFPADLGCNTRK